MVKSELTSLLILIVLIEFSMWIFLGVTASTTVLFDMFSNGLTGGSTDFVDWLLDNILALVSLVGVATIVVGTLIATERTFAIYAAFAFVFLGYSSVFFDMARRLVEAYDKFFSLSGGGYIMAMVVLIPIMILYIVTILRFWRGLE